MAYIQKDRVKETTTTTGTGAVTLAGAVAGFQAFSAVMSVADTCYYVIVSATGADWETGTGTYSSASVLTRTTVLSSSNSGNAVSFAAGTKDVFMGPIANQVNDIAHGGTGATTAADARTNLGVSTGTVTSVAATAGTGISVTGSPITGAGTLGITNTAPDQTVIITAGTGISATGTYPNFTIALGSFTSAQLATALTDETGTGANVFATSPTLVTPLSNNLNAVPVASGAGNSLTIAAGAGVGTGAGGSLILQAGLQATSGGDGKVIVKQVAGQTSNLHEWQNSAATVLGAFDSSGRLVVGKGIATVGIRFQSHEESTQNNSLITTGGNSNSILGFATNINGTSKSVAIGLDVSDNVFKLIYGGAFGGQIAGLNINSSNNVGLGTVGPLAKLHAVAGTAATKGLIVQGAASQTANLQEWQDSAGTVLASVSAAGVVKTIVLTVATLPAAATAGAGARAFVSNATLTTFATVPIGGGANGVPVYSDGTNWYIG